MTRSIGTRGWPSTGWQETDLGEATASAEAEQGVGAGLLAPDGVDGDMATALGETYDRCRDIGPVGEQGVLGAEVGGNGERFRVAIDRDHPGAHGPGDHDRTEPDPAGTDDRDPFALADAGAADESAVRRGEPAPEACSGREPDRVRQGDEVGVGGVERDDSAKDPQCVNPGCCWSGHTCALPDRHHSHRPHPHTNGTVTGRRPASA